MVWGGISLEGRTDLYRLDNDTLTAIRYQDEILGPVVRPYAGAVGPGFLLVHNNARPHVARVCRQFLENEGIDTIDWPTGSPDLNPIEHLWDMFRSIQHHQVALQTVQELSDALVQIWEEIPQDTIRQEEFCDKAIQESRGANMIEDAVMRSKSVGSVDLLCAQGVVIEMDESFSGENLTFPAPRTVPANTVPLVHLPACLKPAKAKKFKVVCTFYKNSTLFKRSAKVLDDVVGISVENEIITNLPEPVRIKFHHFDILENQTATCVSWDTRKDNEIKWREEGCKTVRISSKETECCCNHLTYFAILVKINPTRNVHHLKALTFITAVGCAVSIISCAILFVSLCRKRKAKDQSSLVHRGLVVALFLLCLVFVITGTIANLGHAEVCQFIGALLHYALLSTLCWMAVEVLHTFWMIYVVFSPSPKPWIWYLLGFGLPGVPVTILACIGDIYGERTVMPSDDLAKPYRMCWMTESHGAFLAHFIINVGLLVAVVSSGCIMLFLVIRKIHNRDEWRRNRVAFLSIWGLSCLFGTTWMLIFFEDLSEAFVFLFCIINSLQGFFLMLRFFALERLRKKSGFGMDGSSTGSTRQQMLQTHEKS
ncbi:hypothetical protein NFI96_013525 [Prochilodus magdalenae]|nr:hypothetical protein NFI96_013525 [Prochilodus magdalenae]